MWRKHEGVRWRVGCGECMKGWDGGVDEVKFSSGIVNTFPDILFNYPLTFSLQKDIHERIFRAVASSSMYLTLTAALLTGERQLER